jgi:predicted ATPase
LVKRYVLTGAPGAGKTSLLRSLRERGWAVVEEAATEVIAREQAAGFDEPWQSSDFVNKIVTLQRERSNSALRLSRRASLRSLDSRRMDLAWCHCRFRDVARVIGASPISRRG